MKFSFVLFFVFCAISIFGQRQKVIPYPCDSLWVLPKTKPEVIANPDKKVFIFTIPDQVLDSPSDTVCFVNEALIIKNGRNFSEMRTADKTGFNRFVKTNRGIILYRYPPPKIVLRA